MYSSYSKTSRNYFCLPWYWFKVFNSSIDTTPVARNARKIELHDLIVEKLDCRKRCRKILPFYRQFVAAMWIRPCSFNQCEVSDSKLYLYFALDVGNI